MGGEREADLLHLRKTQKNPAFAGQINVILLKKVGVSSLLYLTEKMLLNYE